MFLLRWRISSEQQEEEEQEIFLGYRVGGVGSCLVADFCRCSKEESWMDFPEATKIVYDRIQKPEPENVSKIIGYVLLQDNGEREMIRLACGPDSSIHSLIAEAKSELGLANPMNVAAVVSAPYQFPPYSPGSNLRTRNTCWDAPGLDFPGGYFCPKPARRISSSPPQYSVKICHYFLKGFCKHGHNCRYFHGTPTMVENFPQHVSLFPNDPGIEDHRLSHGSLEKLELEITELLKSRGGSPVSIASLPMLYYEKYGRTLQAEGYLTESQRNGKAGFSLSKLLARLKNSIRLIDRRPHGQHSVILAEDVQKYSDYERSDPSGIGSASRQIYLTFPAESTFTEQDVSNYFNKFGPVQDVRIPSQQKRMFGFVTFVFTETAKQILSKGNPHFICGARVLVKPYKEKSRLADRKYADKTQSMSYYNQRLMEGDPEIQSNDLLEECEHALELERRRLAELQVAPKSSPQYPYFGYPTEYFNPSEAREQPSEYASVDRINYLFDVVNNGSSSKDNVLNCNDQDSIQGINLPESPFASGISTVT
ncbi:zinc finger CCCH domain-containing protein 18 isoform X3 [Punica granatum]|uniref:Zinc finger CCCH domain-containing protein 18 isoform X3 n=1 Tax=Punica granatum TaxID=22663 RepID=A0A6P8C6E3_PUNGR|nr:zinc finger CCCH domain-containing protein 18 isoform X3 [Punica granatum]